MSKQREWTEQLRSDYFDILSELTSIGSQEVIRSLLDQLCKLVQMTYAGICLYDEWTRQYNVTITSHNQEKDQLYIMEHQFELIKRIKEQTRFNTIIKGQDVFSGYHIWSDAIIIRLEDNLEQAAFLVIQYKEESMTMEDLNMLKNETEKFLHLVSYFDKSHETNKRNQLLIDLSSYLYSIHITDILTGISHSLNVMYPNFTHYLLLARDYESNHLPLKPMVYNEGSSTTLSSQAFLTGEVQIQVNTQIGHTYLYVPLKGNQGVYGVIELISPHIIYYSEHEISFISQFAHTAGKAMENAILYQSSSYLVSDLKYLNNIVKTLNSNMKFPELLGVLKSQIKEVCDASEVGFIYYHTESENGYTILPESTAFFNSPHGERFTHSLVQQMNLTNEPIFNGNYCTNDQDFLYRSVMFIPMVQHQTVHGIVAIMHENISYFTFEKFKLMQALIGHSTLALINSVLNQKLETAVITDYLTKLYSRNYLDDMITLHMELDERGSLLLMDIDDFKHINDTYGHYVGDKVILNVADVLKSNIGDEGIAARWGGEEFAIYLPHADVEDGVHLAERIREQVEQELIDPKVTISCGVSNWVKGHHHSVQKLFIHADEALYRAKEGGKNSIVQGVL